MLQRNTDPGTIALWPARRSVYLILAAVTFVATIGIFVASLSYFRAVENDEVRSRLTLYDKSLNDTLDRFQHLPFVLARDPLIMEAGSAPNPNLNERLEAFATKAQLEAIYLMDLTGLVLASSNHDAPQTFLGQNYGFRPYFTDAIAGSTGEFFGVGATTGRPGYFVSEPVRNGTGDLVGVIAIKLDMSELQQSWEASGQNVFVSDANGVVVLASNPDWLYRTLARLTPAQEAEIANGRQFGDRPLTPLDWKEPAGAAAVIDGESFLYATSSAGRLGWNVHFLLSESHVFERATLATIIFGSFVTLLLVFATFLRSERVRAALAVSQSDRAQLQAANLELQQAQEELSRSGKLAALGQLAASVTHELGQPISALRNYLTAAEIAGAFRDIRTQEKLNAVVDRMENITRQLKFFTKPGGERLESVALQDVVANSLDLVDHDLRARRIQTVLDVSANPVTVSGNRLRLEQVVVNLINNGLAAMADTEQKVLTLKIQDSGPDAVLIVSDTGQGFGNRSLAQMQEPFHTTRASGDGMGLGLSIASAIIKEHGGWLSAENRAGGGARFSVAIPRLKPVDLP